MNLQGRVQNGVVVLDGGLVLPEGAAVIVSYAAPAAERRKRIAFPLVRSAKPGSLNLTSDQIADILEEEDVSS